MSLMARFKILTLLEYKVLRMVAYGLSNKEIAGLIHYSEDKVSTVIRNMYRKIDAHNRVEAALYYHNKPYGMEAYIYYE